MLNNRWINYSKVSVEDHGNGRDNLRKAKHKCLTKRKSETQSRFRVRSSQFFDSLINEHRENFRNFCPLSLPIFPVHLCDMLKKIFTSSGRVH